MRFVVCAAAVLAGTLSSQATVVFPSDHALREGTSRITDRPLSGGISRVQIIYSNWRNGIPDGAQIRRIGLRPDEAGTGSAANRQVQLEIWMAHSNNFGSTASTTFANNYAAPAVRVCDPRTLTLPQIPPVMAGPHPVPVWIPLDRPFTYDAGRNLVVEYRVTGNNNGNSAFEYASDRASFVSHSTSFGTSCRDANGWTSLLSAGPALSGATWRVTLANTPGGDPMLLIGLSNTSWAGNPLPMSLAAFGSPFCTLQVSADVILRMTMVAGVFQLDVRLPEMRDMYGTWLYAQAVRMGFSPPLVVTSASVGATVGVLPQATMIDAVGDANAPTGSRTLDYGLITLFEF